MNKKKRVQLKEELKKIFSDLYFDEFNHYYGLVSDPNFKFKTSVSKIADSLSSFDKDYWSKRKAIELGVTQEQVLKEWDEKSKIALKRGTEIHKELENYTLDNRRKASPVTKLINKTLITQGFRFIANELRIYDKESRICGTLDVLAYNIYTEKFYIIDYKSYREKEITKVEYYIDKNTGEKRASRFMLPEPYNRYPDSKYYRICIQLCSYKKIIEKNTNIKIEGIYIIQISDLLFEEGFKLIEGEILDVDYFFNVNKKS